MYRLVFDQRASAPAPFVTRAPVVVIGRGAQCQLRLLDNGVSSEHAVIERDTDGYYPRDLATTNGSRATGKLITRYRLAPGDELEFGGVRLTFEIMHEPAARRLRLDWLQITAFVVVAALLAGQVVLFTWIFSQHRRRGMRIDAGREARPVELRPGPSDAPLDANVPQPTLPLGATTNSGIANPPLVLGKSLRIVRVDRADAPTGVTLTILVRAGVGERELNVAAVGVSVQFLRQPQPQEGLRPVPLPLQWLTVPAQWENFSSRKLTVRFPGAPRQLAGYIIQTYYHNQLQDVQAEPPTLAPAAGASTVR